jgi:hypothetical protein
MIEPLGVDVTGNVVIQISKELFDRTAHPVDLSRFVLGKAAAIEMFE